MILVSAQVRNARVLAMSEAVEFDPTRINILHGPNGAGKSTLFSMMHHALALNHSSRSEVLSLARPWGSEAAPYVVLTFEHGGKRYRIEKQFLSRPFSRLFRANGSGWKEEESGAGADDKVREFVRASGVRDSGLLSMLWCPQGEMPLVEPLSANALDSVRALLGAHISGRVGSAVEKAVEKRWEVYFTATGRQKSSSPLTALEAEFAKTQEKAGNAREALEKIEGHRQTAAKAKADHENGLRRLQALRSELGELEKAEAEYNALRQMLETAALAKTAANGNYMQAQSHLDAVVQNRSGMQEIRAKIPGLETAAEAAARTFGECEEAVTKCQDDFAGVRAMEQKTRDAAERLGRAERWARLKTDAEEIEARLDRALRLDAEKIANRQSLALLNAPDSSALNSIQRQAREVEMLEIKRDALALRMELSIDPAREVKVSKGVRGADAAITGIGEIAIEIAGVGGIRVKGPDQGAADIEASLKTAKSRLVTLCEPFGTHHIAELASRTERRRQIESELGRLDLELRSALEERPVEHWREQRKDVEAAIAAIAAVEPAWAAAAPEIDALRADAEHARATLDGVRQRLFGENSRANQALLRATEAKSNATRDLNFAQAELNRLSGELSRLEADGIVLAERQARVSELRRKADTAEEEWRGADAAVERLDPASPSKVANVRESVFKLEGSVKTLSDEIVDAEASQRALLQQSSYTDLARAEENAAEIEAEIARGVIERDGIRLLCETLRRHRDESLRHLPGPVAASAGELVREFAGRSLGRFELNNEFLPQGVIPGASGAVQEINIFSGGEQEQIHLAIRLALADHCAANEKQVMVLDDSLLNTDDDRLKRVMEAIERRRDKLQFVILTCHPERYGWLRDVNWISLEQRVAAGA